ncbi:MAG TPA: glycosyltransferase family 2 protein [Streptosporangiaceae bacterium]|nr:glycosyltransferase family 2 protein [Streptosporangiaceae bacterium]
MHPDLTVVIPSLNGARGVDRCLRALAAQSIRPRMEILVIDDGSTDDTASVARAHGVTVISHPGNRGIAAARNTGLNAATADIVAFLDDDCEPEPEWARHLLSGYAADDVAGVSGPIIPRTPPGYLSGFLTRNNPLVPLELELTESYSLPYRFYLYLRRQWSAEPRTGPRDVYSFAGANMSFRRKALFEAGQFDERFRFGAEELDMCMRVAQSLPGARLAMVPGACVVHHFKPQLRDTLRRSRSYGIGSARLHRKWPALPPTVFPGPVLVLALLAAAAWLPALAIAGGLAPLLLYPRGLRTSIREHEPAAMFDAYVRLAQESCEDFGIAVGSWRFRRLEPERPRDVVTNPSLEQVL